MTGASNDDTKKITWKTVILASGLGTLILTVLFWYVYLEITPKKKRTQYPIDDSIINLIDNDGEIRIMKKPYDNTPSYGDDYIGTCGKSPCGTDDLGLTNDT